MDARRLTFDDRIFDLALFVGVLHHMADQLVRDCLAEVRRVLKDDGKVLVAEPVFRPRRRLSHLLPSLDRRRRIRSQVGYRDPFSGFRLDRRSLGQPESQSKASIGDGQRSGHSLLVSQSSD